MRQAAETLGTSDASVRQLTEQKTLPARQVVKFAPWMIERAHLMLPAVHRAVRLIQTGRRPSIARGQQRPNPYEKVFHLTAAQGSSNSEKCSASFFADIRTCLPL
jgi:hypothetical protein